MSRTPYAAKVLVREIHDAFGTSLQAEPCGTPDGWGTVRTVQVTGDVEVVQIFVAALEVLEDPRIERLAEFDNAVLVQFRPRADDQRPYGLGRAVRALFLEP